MDEVKDMELDSGAEILTLVDDDGVEHEFELVDSVEIGGERFVALVPVFGDDNELLDESGELVVLRTSEEDGEEFLEAIENESEFDKVSALFMDRLSDVFDFENEQSKENGHVIQSEESEQSIQNDLNAEEKWIPEH